MKNASGNGENMPYRMKIFYLFNDVKNDPDRVKQTSDKKQPKRQRSAAFKHRLHRENYYPTDRYIAYHGEFLKPLKVYGIQHDPQNRRAPHYSEQRPPKRPAERNKRYRCVRSGNQ